MVCANSVPQKPPCRGRWMRATRADGGSPKKLTSLCLFQPLSRLAATAPRSGSLLACFTNSQIKPALKGEVANEVSRRGCKEAYLLFVWFTPSVSPTARQLPGRGAFWCSIQAQTITPRSGISHCVSNISLRIRAISPCVSRISSRVSALPPTSSCYSRGSGCGTRAAARWAVSA